ncbi:MAG: NADH-quinone oxidoreductase subunit N [Deltaproteobacteria bacterium]|nr:NADH-quinone oxidoreductase subunit N [Deltaproteobacteria bacterium]
MQFNILDVIASLPEIIVFTAATLLLIIDLFLGKGKKHIIGYISLAVILTAWVYTCKLSGATIYAFNSMFIFDGYSSFFKMVFYLSTILAILLSMNYIKVEDIEHGEYYILLLFALSGMMLMASGMDLISIYIGLELMAISIYVLTGLIKQDVRSNEAAMKYIILGALSSGILLYGISLVYGLTGTTQLSAISEFLKNKESIDPALLLAIVFLVAGFGFKVAAVPFHMWAPDVYEGAPTSITAFMSVGPKAAGFAVLLRVFLDSFGSISVHWLTLISVLSVATMVVGSIVALVQTNIKRMLAYSSIAHAGYGLLGFVAGGRDGIASVMLYMLIYAFMNMGIFGAIIVMRKGNFHGENITDYTGLAKVHKGMALLMLIFLFSLAGIPPTAGFVAKFYVFMALINKGFITLAIIGAVMSAVSAYFYIRIVMLMYMKEPEREFALAQTLSTRIALAIAVFGTVLIGVLPTWFIDWAQKSVFSM